MSIADCEIANTLQIRRLQDQIVGCGLLVLLGDLLNFSGSDCGVQVVGP